MDATIEQLIVRMAKDSSGWRYERIVFALANLGHEVSDQTVGNVLKRLRALFLTLLETQSNRQ